MSVIGVDVGGTKIEAILFDGQKVLKSIRIPTEAEKKYTHVLQNIMRAIDAVRDKHVSAIGIGTPGYVDNGVLYGCRNNPSLVKKHLARDISKLSGLRVLHENDAKCFALAEAVLGAAKHKKSVAGIVIGTGVGTALVIDTRIIRGKDGAAGELGHAPYLEGHFEQYIAGPGVQRLYKEAGGTIARDTAQILLAGKSAPDWSALNTVRKIHLEALARLVATMIFAYNPTIIVFGGGLSRSINFSALRKRVKALVPSTHLANTPLKPFKISDSAGSIGAALLALGHHTQ